MHTAIAKYLALLSAAFLWGLMGQAQAQAPAPCSNPPPTNINGQQSHTFSNAAGGSRSFYVSLPCNYNDSTPNAYKLVVVFPGTDTTGAAMHTWFGIGWMDDVQGIEQGAHGTAIFVYPDPKERSFGDWGSAMGWELGPNGNEAAGNEDIQFTDELLTYMTSHYPIDPGQIFVTGHSWGGDMAEVTACFLGNRIRAAAPIAANNPSWFYSGSSPVTCQRKIPMWISFGLDDEHFAPDESYDGEFGVQQADFWVAANGCDSNNKTTYDHTTGNYPRKNKTIIYSEGCPDTNVVLNLYKSQYTGGGDEPGHYPPDYLPYDIGDWFSASWPDPQ